MQKNSEKSIIGKGRIKLATNEVRATEQRRRKREEERLIKIHALILRAYRVPANI